MALVRIPKTVRLRRLRARLATLPAIVLLAFAVPSAEAATYYSFSHANGVTTVRAGTSGPGVFELFDSSQRDYPALQPPNYQGLTSIKLGEFGTASTYAGSITAPCEPGWRAVLCPPGPVVFRGGPWNEFVTADLYYGGIGKWYWLSTPLTAHGEGGQDNLQGGRNNDHLHGGAHADRLTGNAGSDTLVSGPALAYFGDRLTGDGGNDALHSANGSSDVLDCGANQDTATADQWDKVTGCEQVMRVQRRHVGAVLSGRDANEMSRGTAGPDKYYGTARPNAFYGLGDSDLVHGGRGIDRLHGGPGRDSLHGGPGNDHLNSRDKRRGDLVNCGPGRDRALVDRGDRVAGCETVRYR